MSVPGSNLSRHNIFNFLKTSPKLAKILELERFFYNEEEFKNVLL